jgi:hypothetical protein
MMLPLANLIGSIAIYTTLNAGDYTSTRYALSNPNVSESCAFCQDSTSRAVLAISSAALLAATDNEIGKHSKKAQLILRGTAFLWYGYVTVHNIKTGQRR